jgi:HSP20 family protein
MTLVKFNNRPYRHLDNVFDDLFNGFPSVAATTGNPAVNIYEHKDSFVLELNVPGRTKEEFSIAIDKGLLTVSAEKKEPATSDDVKAIRREFTNGGFKRSFTVDEKIDVNNVQAKYENGILSIELPKKEEAKPQVKQINIQ